MRAAGALTPAFPVPPSGDWLVSSDDASTLRAVETERALLPVVLSLFKGREAKLSRLPNDSLFSFVSVV